MKKRALAVLLLALTFSLAGCGDTAGEVESTQAGTVSSEESVESSETTQDTAESVTETENTSQETETAAPEQSQEPESEAEDGTGKGEIVTDIDNIFTNEVKTLTYNASPVTFNFKGVKYTSPSDYLVMYSQDYGPLVYMSNVFQMKMIRKDSTFDEVLAGLDALDDMAIEGGAKSVVQPTTKTIGGKTYAYFVVAIDDENIMGILTESPDGTFTMGGQIVIQSATVAFDDLVNMYASIASTARITDEADSNDADIDAQIRFIVGEKRNVSLVQYKTAAVKCQVPDGYYYTSETSGVSSATQFFSGADLEVYVSIEEKAFPEDTAEYAIDSAVLYDENTVKYVEEVDGKTVYMFTSYYTSENNGKTYYSITAKCDLDDEYTYCVSADRVDKGEISFELIRDFFVFH